MQHVRTFVSALIWCVTSHGAVATFLQRSSRAEMSPVSRVVELLEAMRTRLEQDHKKEEDLYENFVCWGKSVIEQKEQFTATAQARIDELKTYIDDLDNNRIELTSERVDLEKDIKALTDDIRDATNTRVKEAADYQAAKEEMEQAITALTQAIEVLNTATKDHKDGVLLSLRGKLNEGFTARAQEAAYLTRAVDLGSRVLSKGDAVFLRRVLMDEVPDRASWKKLNRKATFKMDYKARSFKIQGVLASMLENFENELNDSKLKEEEALSVHTKLMSSKNGQLTNAQESLAKMEKENGAKSLSKQEATEEKDALEAQVSRDAGYMSDVQKALDDKKTEWKARQELRTAEQAMLSEAIHILHSDDSRDLFKKSFSSQGSVFLQETQQVHVSKVAQVKRILEETARRSGDLRLLSTFSRSHFDEVITAIDTMIGVLQEEETKDLKNKENCETDRAADTRTAIELSRSMDEDTEQISSLTSAIAALNEEIKEKTARREVIAKELADAAAMRAKEEEEYQAAKKDDEDAVVLVDRAKDTIQNFYQSRGLMLAQKGHRAPEDFKTEAGELAPPPPTTWDGAYGGRKDESSGIIAILMMISDDIKKDITKATTDNDAAKQLYQKTKSDLETEDGELDTSISELNSAVSSKEQDVQSAITDRSADSNQLAPIMKKMSDAAPGCDFIAINFGLRSHNRHLEIDGLEKAKDILQGGKFDGLPDPNRELKPGDA